MNFIGEFHRWIVKRINLCRYGIIDIEFDFEPELYRFFNLSSDLNQQIIETISYVKIHNPIKILKVTVNKLYGGYRVIVYGDKDFINRCGFLSNYEVLEPCDECHRLVCSYCGHDRECSYLIVERIINN